MFCSAQDFMTWNRLILCAVMGDMAVIPGVDNHLAFSALMGLFLALPETVKCLMHERATP